MSWYDELRARTIRDIRRNYLSPALKNRGPTATGAYAMLYNPFVRALQRRKAKEKRARRIRAGKFK